MRQLIVTLSATLAALAMGGAAQAAKDVGPRAPGSFDYYVLSFSWVPGFCASHRSDPECAKHLGFALHGLWPELEGGDYPSDCSQAALTSAERRRFADVYPDASMLEHEWPKHGACSGLSAADYFALATKFEGHVTIPASLQSPQTLKSSKAASVRHAFIAANPGMPNDGVNVITARGVVTEVDVCLTKAGAFRSCAAQ
jgi:ribonuclease T2